MEENFYHGQIIEYIDGTRDLHFEAARKWAEENKAHFLEIEPKEDDIRQFKIVELSLEELAEEKRDERNALLDVTDKYMISDYPITAEERKAYILYRQYLRDIPEAADFPYVEVLNYDDWFVMMVTKQAEEQGATVGDNLTPTDEAEEIGQEPSETNENEAENPVEEITE